METLRKFLVIMIFIIFPSQTYNYAAMTGGGGGGITSVSYDEIEDASYQSAVSRKVIMEDFTPDGSYEGTALPVAEGWVKDGSITEADVCSVADGILTLDTTGITSSYIVFEKDLGSPNISGGFTLETRAKYVANSENGKIIFLQVRDGTLDRAFQLYFDHENLYLDVVDGSPAFPGATIPADTLNWHTYRVCIAGGTCQLFIDGVLSYTVPLYYYTWASNSRVSFGDNNTAAGTHGKAQFDYIRYIDNEALQRRDGIESTLTSLDIGGSAVSGTFNMRLTTSGAGGFDTGNPTPNSWIYLYASRGASGNTTFASASSTFAGATAPAGYDVAGQRIGTLRVDGTGYAIKLADWENSPQA